MRGRLINGRMATMTGRIPIDDVRPRPAGGEHPAKAVVGELVPVTAVSYREGHDAMGVNVVWMGPDGQAKPFTRLSALPGSPDHWHGLIQPDAVGEWSFTVEAFADPYLSWHHAVTAKLEAGQSAADLANDLAIGASVLDAAAELVPADRSKEVTEAAAALRDSTLLVWQRTAPALELTDLLWAHPVRQLVTAAAPARIWVDRPLALFSAWYEMFPRSEGAEVARDGTPVRHGTFASATRRLPGVAAMGFDIVYLPPIHPIGRVNRKGRNNALVARPSDVGSPWAIGSVEGGHDAVHPQLGIGGRVSGIRRRGLPVRAGGRARPGPAVRPRPSLGGRTPGVVHHPA